MPEIIAAKPATDPKVKDEREDVIEGVDFAVQPREDEMQNGKEITGNRGDGDDVWVRMKERGLKNIPVADQDLRPLGVLNALDILQVLLKESEDEEAMLRDYVMGVGY